MGLDELNAMMVTLTISGVKPAEAATALRSAMMALIKPSQDLQKELRQLGFESGPQMIAALGLEGALAQAAREHGREHVGLRQVDSQRPGDQRGVAGDG